MNNQFDCPIYLKDGKVIDQTMTNIEKILHSKKLNYKDLKFISNPYFKDNECETINIFIDLFDIIKPIYSPQFIEEFKTIRTQTKMNIISEIINIVGHYRHFFMKMYGKFTTIILYYSNKEDSYLKSINPDYKKEFYNKRILNKNSEYYIINKIITECFMVIKEYLKYIPHVYFINTGITEPRFLPYLIINNLIDTNGKIDPNDFNIIMTNNKLSLLDIIYNKNTIIFINDYIRKYYLDKSLIFDELKLDNNIGIDLNYLPILFALSGDKNNGLPNIDKMRYKKSFNFMKNNIDNLNNITEDLFKNKKDYEIFKNNLSIINPKTYPFNEFKKLYIEEQIIDIKDFEYIKQETFNIFDSSCVVLFDYLYDGEEI